MPTSARQSLNRRLSRGAVAGAASAAMAVGFYPLVPALMLAQRRTRRLGPLALAREWARGVGISAARIGRLPLPSGDRRGDRPVLLVHGYAMSATSFAFLARRLAAVGLGPIIGHEYWSLGSIARASAGLGRHLESVRRACGVDRVDVVGHSMGGVVGRHYAAIGGGAGLGRLITLGSPHGGSAAVGLGVGRARRELVRGSDILEALARAPLPESVAMTVVHSPDDVLCGGPHNAEVPGAEIVSIDGVDHLGMLTSRQVAELVIARLVAQRSADDRAEQRRHGRAVDADVDQIAGAEVAAVDDH